MSMFLGWAPIEQLDPHLTMVHHRRGSPICKLTGFNEVIEIATLTNTDGSNVMNECLRNTKSYMVQKLP